MSVVNDTWEGRQVDVPANSPLVVLELVFVGMQIGEIKARGRQRDSSRIEKDCFQMSDNEEKNDCVEEDDMKRPSNSEDEKSITNSHQSENWRKFAFLRVLEGQHDEPTMYDIVSIPNCYVGEEQTKDSTRISNKSHFL